LQKASNGKKWMVRGRAAWKKRGYGYSSSESQRLEGSSLVETLMPAGRTVKPD